MWIRERDTTNDDSALADRAGEEARLRRWVARLAIPRHRLLNARANRRIREGLAAAFERFNLSLEVQGQYQNLVALPRCAPGTPATFIAAHYDSVPGCPGADDNASGLAVMLECARAIAELAGETALGFIAFNAEEDGLLGSRDFVARGLGTLPCAVRAIHVLEMVGFRARDPASTRQSLPLPSLLRKLMNVVHPFGGDRASPRFLDRFEVPDYLGLIAKGRSNALL